MDVRKRKLNHDVSLFLVAGSERRSGGHLVMGGYDGHRGSAYYSGRSPGIPGRGIANALLNRLEKKTIALAVVQKFRSWCAKITTWCWACMNVWAMNTQTMLSLGKRRSR